MHPLVQRVLSHTRQQQLLGAGDRIGVAVSGGTDSVALLHLLLELRHELGIVLSVVHFNHRLRGAESDADQEFVAGLAREHDLEFFSDSDDVAVRAAEDRISVETAARELRYGFFQSLLGSGLQGLKPDCGGGTLRGPEGPLFHGATLNKVVTGHTLDDQAETVLMRIIRGTGLRGLGAIHPRILIENENNEPCGEIARPLLGIRHSELEQYLKDIGQNWREDSSNTDDQFTRNRVRKLIVPLLEKEFNPAVAENLAELADIARGEEDYWENEVAGWLGTTVQWSEPDWAIPDSERSLVQIALPSNSPRSSPIDPELDSRIDNAPWKVVNASVSRMWFLAEPVAVQRRLVKAIGNHAGISLEFKHVEEILHFAAEVGPSGKELPLPLGWKLLREPEQLVFLTPDLRGPTATSDYEYALPMPGRIAVAELGSSFEARRVPGGAEGGYNPDNLLGASSLPGPLRVRNWRAGDRYWPVHTKSPKKIKELLQERHIALPERKLWPVLLSGDEIVWMRGFPVPAKFRATVGQTAILILETVS